MKKEEIIARIFGVLSGLLLTMPHFWPKAVPLQAIALIPVLFLASSHETTYRRIAMAGVYMGIFYVLPQAFVLRMPLWITLLLFTELIILFTIFLIISHWLFLKISITSAIAVGATLVLLDWLNFTVVPVWGNAQSIVRPWSEYPKIISFVSITGLTGIIFLLGSLQGLIVNIIVSKKQRLKFISAAAVIMGVFMTVNLVLQAEKPKDNIKVSAIGGIESISYPRDANSLYAELVRKAAQENSKLVVSPELGFNHWSGNNDKWFLKFQDIARENNISLIIGAALEQYNKAVFIGSDGRILGDYTKKHPIPFEGFKKGDSEPLIVPIDGISTGVMICHDDNFTDISRYYGRKEASIVAVPTLDWSQVKNAHLQSSINRAIESNYAVVRACQNGISAIISPKGKVLKKMDHFNEGTGVITCEIPLYSGKTIFSLLGNWPVVPCAILLLLCIVCNKKLRISHIRNMSDLKV
jgi:apolipoprotein N-acyltransferase